MLRSSFLTMLIAFASLPAAADAHDSRTSPDAPTVVLVHGAFADASSWDKVIARLHKRGVPVVAVDNPLTSLEDDVAATKRVIEIGRAHV